MALRRVSAVDTCGEQVKGDVVARLKQVDEHFLKAAVVEQLNDVSTLDEQKRALVLGAEQVLAAETALTGGKGSSLAILNAIEAVVVPRFFCVTTVAFREHFQSDAGHDMLERLQKLTDQFCEACISPDKVETDKQAELMAVFEQAARLRNHILTSPLHPLAEQAIKAAYAEHGSEVAVAVRSSATTEDTKDASFAGQHDTFLNQRGEQDVLDSVRKCWASIFTDRAVEYRGRNKVLHRDAVMSVVVQNMVDPTVAGTAFSVELSTGFPAIHIAATYGLGEAVVSGEVTSDEWLLDLEGKGDKVVKRVKGAKDFEFIMKANASGVEHVAVDEVRRGRYCMETATVRAVAVGTRAIQKVYKQLFGYDHVDTEFAVDKSGGVLVLQSRPVVPIEGGSVMTVDRKAVKTGDQIVKGAYSLLGAVSGRCKLIRDFDDLVKGNVSIEPSDILVTAKTSNYWNQYLTNLRGIVTMDGSPTAHPMLIGRERGLPVICGIPGLMRTVAQFDGKAITIDGLTKWMYVGEKPLRTASRQEVEGQFVVQKPVMPKEDVDTVGFLEEYHRVRKDKNGDVWCHNPNTPLSPAWCVIRRTIYNARFPLVNSARESKLSTDPFGPEHCVFPGNIVADKLVPASQTLKAFEGMTLEDCDRYHKVVDMAAKRYLKVCSSFAQDPSVSGWKQYLEAYAPMYAALWLSYFWRMHVKMVSSTAANEAGMSQLHYGQMLADMQERMQGLEEDYAFRQQIVALADKVRPYVLTGSERQQLEDQGSVRMSAKSVLALALSDSTTRAQIEHIAKSFRIEKNTDIALDAPVALVIEKIVEALECGAVVGRHVDLAAVVEFFPSNADLQEAIRIHITSRLQNSNCHHVKWRGQWKLKEGLAKVCRRVGLDMDRLFALETPEKIEAVIVQYEKMRAGCETTIPFLPSPRLENVEDRDAVVDAEGLKALRSDIAAMQTAMLQGFASLQGELQMQRAEIASLRLENAELRKSTLGNSQNAAAGSALEAVRAGRQTVPGRLHEE